MKQTKCTACNSSQYFHKRVLGGEIEICRKCKLGFSDIKTMVDYEHETNFVLSNQSKKQWQKFALRDYNLVKEILLASDPQLQILEIGSGLGCLSDAIEENLNITKYVHVEPNLELRDFLTDKGKIAYGSLSEVENYEPHIIIMDHVLEHIPEGLEYLNLLFDRWPNATLVLFQTNHRGLIPKFLPYLWYGWQLSEHFYHFTPESILEYATRARLRIVYQCAYKLDQVITFSIKGLIKLGLKLLNLVLPKSQSDGFVIALRQEV